MNIEQEKPRPEDDPNYCISCEAKKIGAEVPEECICGPLKPAQPYYYPKDLLKQ